MKDKSKEEKAEHILGIIESLNVGLDTLQSIFRKFQMDFILSADELNDTSNMNARKVALLDREVGKKSERL